MGGSGTSWHELPWESRRTSNLGRVATFQHLGCGSLAMDSDVPEQEGQEQEQVRLGGQKWVPKAWS